MKKEECVEKEREFGDSGLCIIYQKKRIKSKSTLNHPRTYYGMIKMMWRF
jgi:hypothetical protein